MRAGAGDLVNSCHNLQQIVATTSSCIVMDKRHPASLDAKGNAFSSMHDVPCCCKVRRSARPLRTAVTEDPLVLDTGILGCMTIT